MLSNKQFTDKLHSMENSEREKNSSKLLNANKYDRIMRSLSIKREPNRAVRKANVNIVQNFDETKLYVPPSAAAVAAAAAAPTAAPLETVPTTSTAAATATSHESPVNNDTVNGKDDAKQNIVPNLNDPDSMAEVNINELINTIIDCLQDGCANWFRRATHKDTHVSEDDPFPKHLRDLIPKALNYVEFNLKRTNNYINEFETILKMSQFAQENELLHNNEVSIKSVTENRQVSTPSPVQILEPPKEKDHHSRFSIKRSKSLKAPKNTTNSSNTLKPEPKPTLNNGQSEPELSINVPQTPLFNVLPSKQDPLSMIDVMRNHTIQLNFSEIEHDITQISYCLNVLNRFWTKVNHKPETASFDTYLNSFYQNYCANNINSCFSKLENYLFNINWKITSKNHASTFSDDYENEALNSELCAISLTPTSQSCALNINFLTSYYKLVNYDFITFKLFARQLQLIQLAAILCQTVIRIFNYYHSNIHGGGSGGGGASGIGMSKDCLVFPSSQYKPISWSNTHVTLYNNQKSPNSTLKLPTTTTDNQNLNQSNQNLDSSINHDQETDESNKIINEFFIDELKDFIHNSIVRLNHQSDIINNIGYFYIVNKSNGLVLEAIDLPDNNNKSDNSNSNSNSNTSKLASKSKCPRFYLTQKQKNKNEQLWYYYLYNGCIANKIVRSGHCMAASSLNPRSPVCLWPNVRTTNCKWFFNYNDQTIFSGLTENLVLDYLVKDDDNGQHLVVVNRKEPNKQSQKWTIEFF